MLVRADSRPNRIEVSDFGLLKSATHKAIEAAGPLANVSHETRLDQGTLSRAGNLRESNFIPIDDAVRIDAMTGDCTITRTMAALLGYRLVPINQPNAIKQSLIHDAADIAKESGELVSEAINVASDGVITPNEAKRVDSEAADAERVLHRIRKFCHGVMKPSR